jgi:hypothetical protein
MTRKKLRRRIRKLERRIAALETSAQPGTIDTPAIDVHGLLAGAVNQWAHYIDDEDDWRTRSAYGLYL